MENDLYMAKIFTCKFSIYITPFWIVFSYITDYSLKQIEL